MRASRHVVVLAGLVLALLALPGSAAAQRPATRRPPPPPESLGIRGVAFAGVEFFAASQTFEAVLGSRQGPTFGGGVNVRIPGGFFAQVVAWRFSGDGQRVFVGTDGQVFPLGIDTSVTITPIEVSGGYRFRRLSRRVEPYVGAGYSTYKYEETSEFAEAGENVTERFGGFHLLGGAEVRLARFVGVAGEVVWTRIPDALGEGGASKAFGERDLGGTGIRVKVVIGR